MKFTGSAGSQPRSRSQRYSSARFAGSRCQSGSVARLSGMIRRVIELPLVYKSYIWYSPEQTRISGHYHRQIVNALAARDSERAELVMKEHVFEARDLLVAHLRAHPDLRLPETAQ